MTYSKFVFKMKVLLLSCGIKDMEGVDAFIQFSYRKYVNPNNSETEGDKKNRHQFQRIILLITLRGKYDEYNNLINNK